MERHFGYLLKVLFWYHEQSMNRALTQMDLTAAQGRVLAYVSHSETPPCAKDSEEMFHLAHPTVSGLLSRLEKKQFLEYRVDEADRRVKRIHLLPKGRECLAQIQQVIRANDARLIEGFTEEEAEEFDSYIQRAIQNVKEDLDLQLCCAKEDNRP